MFVANREEVHAHLDASFRELGLTPRVPVHVMPRLVIGMLDGLALHDFFDPMTADDEEVVQSALETIALGLIQV
jgi:hypothetical protein